MSINHIFSHPPRNQRWSRRAFLTTLCGALGTLAACGRNRTESAPQPSAPPISAANRTLLELTPGPTPTRAIQQTDVQLASRPTPTPTGPALPDRMVIPRIELDIPVVELGWSTNRNQSGAIFSEWDVAAHAAGWHKNSALPEQQGNIVMSGHNNILGAVFRQLDQLRRDDEITLYTGPKPRRYAVERVLIVPEKHATDEQRAENAKWIAPTPDERLTLVSCWPRNDNTHRIIVVAHPIA